MDKSSVRKDRVRLLVDALRSGEFYQGHNKLKQISPSGAERYCCLGVACVVAMRNGLEINETSENDDLGGQFFYFGTQEDTSALFTPVAVMEWYGFTGDNSVELEVPEFVTNKITAVDLNDTHGYSFAKIADAFERTYLGEVS